MSNSQYKLQFSGDEINSRLAAINNKVDNAVLIQQTDILNERINTYFDNIQGQINDLNTSIIGPLRNDVNTNANNINGLNDGINIINNQLTTYNTNFENLEYDITTHDLQLNDMNSRLNEFEEQLVEIISFDNGTNITLSNILKSNIKNLKIYGTVDGVGNDDNIVQLVISSGTEGEFREYKFNLTNKLYSMPVTINGDYIDNSNQAYQSDILDVVNNCVYRKIKKVIFDGIQEEQEYGPWSVYGDDDHAYYYIRIGDMYSVYNNQIICDRFPQASIAKANNNIGINIINSGVFEEARILIRPGINGLEPSEENLPDFKLWLKENPLQISYILKSPIQESIIDTQDIILYTPESILSASNNAYLEIEYIARNLEERMSQLTDIYIKPVSSAWEQKMLDRLDLFMIPTQVLRTMPRCYGTGTHPAGSIIPGINYSSVGSIKEDAQYYYGLVGVQVPLSTYYSAMANPASIIYTAGDVDPTKKNISSYYGITCSSLASFVCGFPIWVYTKEMGGITTVQSGEAEHIATSWPTLEIPINSIDDLFQLERGDLLVNTLDDPTDDSGGHVKIIKDVVYSRTTGKLLGFNIAEATQPCVQVTYMDIPTFMDQLIEERPYHVLRFDKTNLQFDLSQNEIKYSKTVMPNKGEKGLYLLNSEVVKLYIPKASSDQYLIYSINNEDGSQYLESIPINDLDVNVINNVQVYSFVPIHEGTHTMWISNVYDDLNAIDPTTFTVIAEKPRARDDKNEDKAQFIINPPKYMNDYDKLMEELAKLKASV